MSFPKVDIQLQNGQLGAVEDLGGGKGGLLVLVDDVTDHAAGEVVDYGSYDELPEELQAIAGMERYFDLAEGVTVAVMVAPSTTSIADAVSKTSTTPYLKKMLETDTDIRLVGVIGVLAANDLETACSAAHVLANVRAGEYAPVVVFLPYAYAEADTVLDLSESSYNRVGVCVSQEGEEIGLLIGRLASTPVQRNIGRVKDGSMPIDDPVIDATSDPVLYVSTGLTTIKSLHDKGYITMRTHIGRTGVYFTDDPLACLATDDYHSIALRRVIDKAIVITYDTYLDELLNEVEFTSDGKIKPAMVKYLQSIIETAITNQMLSDGEISAVECYIDSDQAILTTGKIEIVLKIVPVGYLKTIVVKLGFTSSLDDE